MRRARVLNEPDIASYGRPPPQEAGAPGDDRAVGTPSFNFRLERVRSLRERAEEAAREELARELNHRVRGEALVATGRPAAPAPPAELDHLRDVPVDSAVEIGRRTMTIGETLALGPGSIITLNRLAGEPVDLLVNGKPIARGEVVVIDEEFGLRITEVVSAARGAEPPAE